MTMHLAVLTFAIASACAPIGAPAPAPTTAPTPPPAAPAPAASSSQSSSEVPAITIVSPKDQSGVLDLRGRTLAEAQAVAGVDSLDAAPNQRNLRQHSDVLIGGGDFVLRATIVIDEFSGRGAAIAFDGGTVNLDDKEWGAVLTGKLFGGGRFPFETERPASALPGAPIEVEISRSLLDRLEIYHQLGVPEIWRCDGTSVACLLRQPDAGYRTAESSQSFPWLAPSQIAPFLAVDPQVTENEQLRRFLEWSRRLG